MTRITFENVSWEYRTGDELAVSEIDLDIESGSFVGITGPSDAGKSTFCRLVPGYIPHYFDGDLEGSVRVGGRDVSEASIGELAESVGMLFEMDAVTVVEEACTVDVIVAEEVGATIPILK